jgi:CubicO group peptidase (beta-lactamase class C family)
MLENYLEKYVDDLYEKQNLGVSVEQQGLYTKKDYYDLLKPVIELVLNYKDYSIDELRNKLYENSNIEESLVDFICKKEMVPGMVFSYGTKNYKETVVIGNRQEVSLNENGDIVPALEKMTDDTIFDLASVTKIFTSISILKLVQNGTISLNDEIVKFVPQFKNLTGVTIYDLITFGVPLKTNGRVDRASSREEAEQILFGIEVDKESTNKRPYTDMGAMVLKYVIESASGMNYYNFVDENILKQMNMSDTHVVVPKMKLDRVASTNLDGKYYKDGNFAITTNAPKGVVYDPKAQIMGQQDGVLSGHAGMFSTASDMTKLAKGIMGGQIIDSEYVEMMAKNRTGKKYIEDEKEKYIQYLGMLCYSKNPILADSELFHAMSGKSFASAGWTGTQLTVDPVNELYFFMAANRSHNRMTFIDPAQRDKVEVDENGKKTIVLPNGDVKIDATRFAWDRDSAVVHPTLKLTIQYKMLEDIYSLVNNVELEQQEEIKHYK